MRLVTGGTLELNLDVDSSLPRLTQKAQPHSKMCGGRAANISTASDGS